MTSLPEACARRCPRFFSDASILGRVLTDGKKESGTLCDVQMVDMPCDCR